MFQKYSGKFSFTKRFIVFILIAVLFCGAGIAGLIGEIFGANMFNFDLDFAGGVSIEMELGVEVTRDVQSEIAEICRDAAGVSASVTTSGNSGTAVTVKTVELSSEERQEIFDRTAERYGSGVSLISADYVSASVGSDLKRAAVISSLLAAVLILVYISIRFEFRSGLAALICLAHDLLVMLSFFVIFQIPMNMTFIAAALTIIGYSINATIVVFDRVRENYKAQGGGNFSEVVDRSIWQSMRRSLGTTFTTLLPVLFISILGVSSIRVFSLPLLVGVIAGGYSSTCLAGPLWNAMQGKKARVK